jgi:hypothetical protein
MVARSRTGFGVVFGFALAVVLVFGGCRVSVTDCGTVAQAEESAWQLRRAGFDAALERCGRGQAVSVPRWDGPGARGAVGVLGLPRRRLNVPPPDVGMWPSPADRARLERHEAGARAAAALQGLPQVEDAWVELRREGSAEVATATVVMREGAADWVQLERVIRGMEGLSGLERVERVEATLPSLAAGVSWAKVGPFRVDAAQAGLLRWSIVGGLVVVFIVSALLAFGAWRRSS